MKLLFTDYPFTKGEHFISGLAEEGAVEELKKLFNIRDFKRNVCCEFPNSEALINILPNVHSQELKNVLLKYEDKKVLIIPDIEDYTLPNNIHYIKTT